jgi:hypothetical protein
MTAKMKLMLVIAIFFLTALACQTQSADTSNDTTGEQTSSDPSEPQADQQEEAPAPSNTPEPTETAEPPTATPVPTEVPPTETPTEAPPTPTPTEVPEPLLIDPENIADDGCTVVELNPGSWNPPFNGFNRGSDPYFHIHSINQDFYFSAEFYTVYGAGWGGQLGTFAPDCNRSGICIYLVPDNTNAYLATDGEVEITALEEVNGVLQLPVEFSLTNLTLVPVPGSGAPGCYHLDAITILIEAPED